VETCVLAATGIAESIGLTAVIALAAIGTGGVVVLVARGRRRPALLALAPLLILGLLVSGSPAPAQAACTTAPAGPSAPTVPAAAVYTPGAAGIGDPYFPLDGNGGYDVQHYGIDLSYEPATDVLAGTTTITAVALQNLSAFNLDLDGLEVASVLVDGVPATFSRATTPISAVTGQPLADGSTDALAVPGRTELTVTPAAGIPQAGTFTTVIAYGGVLITIDDAYGVSGVFHTDDGALIVGQPRVAATWFPSNDHPADKATFSFRVSVPAGLQVVANGRLTGEEAVGDRSVFSYEATSPMATYLATASIGEFEIEQFGDGGIEYLSAIDPDLFDLPIDEADPDGLSYGEVARDAFATEPEVISFLAGEFGPYPFDDAGGIADDVEDLQFALENQTRPIYPTWAFENPADPSTVVHELAHQWYGDSVAVERWSDIWLNEGFATYAEWLWAEHAGGETPQAQFDDLYASIDADDEFWTVELADPGSAYIFDTAVYYRGAMTLQALRTEVGDDAFFQILQGWATQNAGGNVSTDDFVAYAQQVSGVDLTAFFADWIYSTQKPVLLARTAALGIGCRIHPAKNPVDRRFAQSVSMRR
jgi:aminopeptidase N